jgi:hypothetical protein
MRSQVARLLPALFVAALAAVPSVSADSITIGGAVTQSTSDGTGPAVNNPLLNAIQDGDPYTITFAFTGSVTGGGTLSLAGVSVLFSDAAASATESAFNTASITVTPGGGVDQISVLGCLTTGSGCAFGNFVALNFMIPAAALNSSAAAQFIPGLTPLDLLEDDGTTDIQGTVTSYLYTSSGGMPVPEPGTLALLSSGALVAAWRRFARPAEDASR